MTTKYEVGKRLRFPYGLRRWHVITAVDAADCNCEYPYPAGSPADGQHHPNCAIGYESQREVTFALVGDPEDCSTETIAELDAVDVEVSD
jgi:hypothetical protein